MVLSPIWRWFYTHDHLCTTRGTVYGIRESEEEDESSEVMNSESELS